MFYIDVSTGGEGLIVSFDLPMPVNAQAFDEMRAQLVDELMAPITLH